MESNLDQPQSEIKSKIKEWWNDPHQDYDGFAGHGVNSETEKELWGNEIALLLGRMGYDITAVDWAMTMMEKAMEKARAAQVQIRFEVQDAEDLTFPDASFDAVVSRHVLWTLADPGRAVGEWARVVKPGGMVIADIPREGSHSGRHHYGEDIGRRLPLGNGASPDDVAEIFKKAGLSNIRLRLLEKPGEQQRKTVLICGDKE
jgi:SAM-dependent methyltransferase